jgi:hypothetical protein
MAGTAKGSPEHNEGLLGVQSRQPAFDLHALSMFQFQRPGMNYFVVNRNNHDPWFIVLNYHVRVLPCSLASARNPEVLSVGTMKKMLSKQKGLFKDRYRKSLDGNTKLLFELLW